MATFEVCSELYAETDFSTTDATNGNSISKFTFVYPKENEKTKRQNGCSVEEEGNKLDFNGYGLNGVDDQSNGLQTDVQKLSSEKSVILAELEDKPSIETDKDGDLIVERKKKGVIEIDIDVGGLLQLIQANILRNSSLKNPNCNVVVTELNFKVPYVNYPDALKAQLQDVEYVIAADVIYDDNITEAFVMTLENLLLELPKLKGIYIALEKRYVFTLEDMDSVAPSYEHFLRVFYRRNNRFGITRWKLMQIPLNFPRYFEYEKIKDLVLLKISN
ncbi:hypothetical protein RP20_CCG025112 [Aedes albopictus]|nr:hypothetical protein RP20_CCG025112 [Aedes albopictus]